MLTKIQNPKRAYLSRVLALPLLAGTVILFSFRNRVATNEVPDFATLNTAQTITDTIPVKVKKEVSTVDIKTNKEVVVVYTDGSSETLSESAANARGLVHNGGYYNQPASAKVLFRMDTSAKPEPLFILNGKELSRDEMNKLDSKQIASVNVLKGEAAIKAYGDRGKNGVVLISLKEAGNQQDTKFQRNDTAVMQADLKSIHWNQSGEAEINAEKIIVKGYRKPSTNDNKEVVVMGYPRPKTQTSEVVMGKPIVRDSTAVVTVFGKPAMADRNKEVVVVGYAKPRASAQPVFIKAEQPASISQSDWNTFYLQRLRYLEKWMTANADDGEYCVNLSFTVNADGTLSDVVALNDPGYGLAAKVVEQMKYAPRWKPAMQNGKVVISKAGRTTCIVVVKHATE